MKFKKTRQKSDGASIMKVSLEKKDTFNYVVAVGLSNNEIKGLLPFSFPKDEITPDLFYKITNLTPLKTLLETKQSLRQFQSLINQIAELLEVLAANNMPDRNLILEIEKIYVDVDSQSLLFIYLPLDSQPIRERAILDLLLQISQKAQFIIDSDKGYANKLMDFIKRQTVFSLIDLKDFLGLGTAELSGKSNAEGPNIATSGPLGRDFVSELSGVQNRQQYYDSQSIADNILSAISEDLAPKQSHVIGATSEDLDARHQLKKLKLVRLCDGVSWNIYAPGADLGRSSKTQYQITHSSAVSRKHATIVIEHDRAYIIDNGSSNGTFVNSVRLGSGKSAQIKPGDIITLGDESFNLR